MNWHDGFGLVATILIYFCSAGEFQVSATWPGIILQYGGLGGPPESEYVESVDDDV